MLFGGFVKGSVAFKYVPDSSDQCFSMRGADSHDYRVDGHRFGVVLTVVATGCNFVVQAVMPRKEAEYVRNVVYALTTVGEKDSAPLEAIEEPSSRGNRNADESSNSEGPGALSASDAAEGTGGAQDAGNAIPNKRATASVSTEPLSGTHDGRHRMSASLQMLEVLDHELPRGNLFFSNMALNDMVESIENRTAYSTPAPLPRNSVAPVSLFSAGNRIRSLTRRATYGVDGDNAADVRGSLTAPRRSTYGVNGDNAARAACALVLSNVATQLSANT